MSRFGSAVRAVKMPWDLLHKVNQQASAVLCALAFFCSAGCAMHRADCQLAAIAGSPVPRELEKSPLPIYQVEAPDILVIQAADRRSVHRAVEQGDVFNITMTGGDPGDEHLKEDLAPIQQAELPAEIRFRVPGGEFVVGPDGCIDLGPIYGKVAIEGLTLEQAQAELRRHLIAVAELRDPKIWLELVRLGDRQAIAGEHLVRPDGSISLGTYGELYVAGMSPAEIRCVIEDHLRQLEGPDRFQDPKVSVDVLAYNSKVIYVIMDGGGYGEQVIRLPYTGNETVLDAISQVNGLSQVSSKRMWIARPSPANACQTQVLDVHWKAITAEGMTATNYQLMPGDRIYVQADKLIATDNFLGKLLAPIERTLGVISLGRYAIQGQSFGK